MPVAQLVCWRVCTSGCAPSVRLSYPERRGVGHGAPADLCPSGVWLSVSRLSLSSALKLAPLYTSASRWHGVPRGTEPRSAVRRGAVVSTSTAGSSSSDTAPRPPAMLLRRSSSKALEKAASLSRELSHLLETEEEQLAAELTPDEMNLLRKLSKRGDQLEQAAVLSACVVSPPPPPPPPPSRATRARRAPRARALSPGYATLAASREGV